jgi:hypothetical protein
MFSYLIRVLSRLNIFTYYAVWSIDSSLKYWRKLTLNIPIPTPKFSVFGDSSVMNDAMWTKRHILVPNRVDHGMWLLIFRLDCAHAQEETGRKITMVAVKFTHMGDVTLMKFGMVCVPNYAINHAIIGWYQFKGFCLVRVETGHFLYLTWTAYNTV